MEKETEIDPEKIAFKDILDSLRTKQVLGGLTFLASVLGASFFLGTWIEKEVFGPRRVAQAVNAATAPLNQNIADLTTSKGDFEGKLAAAIDANEALQSLTETMRTELVEEKKYAAFMQKYITYLRSDDPNAKSLFVDYVCFLTRSSEERREAGAEVVASQTAQLLRMVGPEAVNSLRQAGYEEDFIERLVQLQRFAVNAARGGPTVSRGQPVTRRMINDARVRKELPRAERILAQEFGALVKVVTFPGRAEFQLPSQVSAAVHGNSNCRLQ